MSKTSPWDSNQMLERRKSRLIEAPQSALNTIAIDSGVQFHGFIPINQSSQHSSQEGYESRKTLPAPSQPRDKKRQRPKNSEEGNDARQKRRETRQNHTVQGYDQQQNEGNRNFPTQLAIRQNVPYDPYACEPTYASPATQKALHAPSNFYVAGPGGNGVLELFDRNLQSPPQASAQIFSAALDRPNCSSIGLTEADGRSAISIGELASSVYINSTNGAHISEQLASTRETASVSSDTDEPDAEIWDIAARISDEVQSSSPCTSSDLPKLRFNKPQYYRPGKVPQRIGTQVSDVERSGATSRMPDLSSSPHAVRSALTKSSSPNHMRTSPTKSTPIPPFVRSQLPEQLLIRSPVPGLAPTPYLQTCFRIGEAIRTANKSSCIPGSDILVELFSRVVSSSLEGLRQHFQFADVFTWQKPPYLPGIWIGWKGVRYWEFNGRAFLTLGDEGGKMCRVVGRLIKVERGAWRLNVLNICSATWDDLLTVKKIACP